MLKIKDYLNIPISELVKSPDYSVEILSRICDLIEMDAGGLDSIQLTKFDFLKAERSVVFNRLSNKTIDEFVGGSLLAYFDMEMNSIRDEEKSNG